MTFLRMSQMSDKIAGDKNRIEDKYLGIDKIAGANILSLDCSM